MKNRGRFVVIAAVLIVGAAILGGLFSQPVVAQIRAALVRDIDTPALSPFRASVSFSLTYSNTQGLLTTVPAGKRLVIEYISYYSGGTSDGEMVFGSLRSGQYGPLMAYLEINPPHAAATPGYTIQDGSMPVKLYFEAGEEVWVSVSKSGGTARNVDVVVDGHLVTP